MPVKRRIAKARQSLGDGNIEDLMYGPGSCLINGEGYLGEHGDGLWRDKSEHVRSAVVDAMRTDWQRHNARVMSAWQDRSKHELWCAERHYGSPTQPWAFTEFGDPTCGD